MNISPLTEHDFTQWYELWQQYLQFYETSLPNEITQNTWQNLLNNPKMQVLGAFDDSGSLKGFVHTVQHPNTWNIGECVYLEDLFVSPDARKQGVARGLIQAVYTQAQANQCNRVYWVTAKNNVAAQNLYHQLAEQTDMIQFRHNL